MAASRLGVFRGAAWRLLQNWITGPQTIVSPPRCFSVAAVADRGARDRNGLINRGKELLNRGQRPRLQKKIAAARRLFVGHERGFATVSMLRPFSQPQCHGLDAATQAVKV